MFILETALAKFQYFLPTKCNMNSAVTVKGFMENQLTIVCAGLEKKRQSESRKHSVTPTVLSASLDQTEALHSDMPSVVQRLKSSHESDSILTMSPSVIKQRDSQVTAHIIRL